jgi:hypothetical protein
MTNEQLDEIALSMAREVGEYNLLNYHEAFKLFARRLLAEAANRQEPVLMMNEVGNTEAVFKDQPQTLGFNTPLYEHPAPAVPEEQWITELRYELMKSKMTHNFTFSRNEVIALLNAAPKGETL